MRDMFQLRCFFEIVSTNAILAAWPRSAQSRAPTGAAQRFQLGRIAMFGCHRKNNCLGKFESAPPRVLSDSDTVWDHSGYSSDRPWQYGSLWLLPCGLCVERGIDRQNGGLLRLLLTHFCAWGANLLESLKAGETFSLIWQSMQHKDIDEDQCAYEYAYGDCTLHPV